MKPINEYPQSHHIPYIVVKNLIKASKMHNQFAMLHSALHRSSILLFALIGDYSIKECHNTNASDINNYDDLVEWLYNAKDESLHSHFNINNINEHQYPSFFGYISDLTNTLIQMIFEGRNLPMKILGQIGQTTFDLTCKTILKEKYVEDGQKDLSTITDLEEIKSILFKEFLKSDMEDFGLFMSQLPPTLLQKLQFSTPF